MRFAPAPLMLRTEPFRLRHPVSVAIASLLSWTPFIVMGLIGFWLAVGHS
jgi:hypothetical protein